MKNFRTKKIHRKSVYIVLQWTSIYLFSFWQQIQPIKLAKKASQNINPKKLFVLTASNLHLHKLLDLQALPQSEVTVSNFRSLLHFMYTWQEIEIKRRRNMHSLHCKCKVWLPIIDSWGAQPFSGSYHGRSFLVPCSFFIYDVFPSSHYTRTNKNMYTKNTHKVPSNHH
jgi:hypothetical protein